MRKKYFYLLLVCASLTIPTLAAAQENAPARNAEPDRAQSNPQDRQNQRNRQNRQNQQNRQTQASQPLQIADVGDRQISTLKNLKPGMQRLVYLGASAESLQADRASFRALQKWIEHGGVMAVYSDAASLFGFTLQPARQGNPQRGGQLFGRADSAIAFGSEPLLWPTLLSGSGGDGAAGNANLPLIGANSGSREGARGQRQARNRRGNRNSGRGDRLSIEDPTTFGNTTIFYNMEEGDSLLVSHPTAIPLLRVTDLAQPRTNLYTSAVASYGNGWVIFMPRGVSIERAQGEQFLYNISSMAVNPPLPVATAALSKTAESSLDGKADYKPLLQELQDRIEGKAVSASTDGTENSDGDGDGNENEEEESTENNAADNEEDVIEGANSEDVQKLMPASLPVPRAQAEAVLEVLKAASSADASEDARAHADAIVAIWMLQAKIQRAVPPSAEDGEEGAENAAEMNADINQWLEEATNAAPESKEVLFWQGVFNAQTASNPLLTSQQRAQAYNDAAAAWNRAAQTEALIKPATPRATRNNQENDNGADENGESAPQQRAPLGTGFGELMPQLLTQWARAVEQAGAATRAEPPITQVVGNVILRHFPDDPTLRLAGPTIQKLQELSGNIGWMAPREEVLIFPNERRMDAYASQLGQLGENDMPMASTFGPYGRVLGNRILMISQPSQPIILPSQPGVPSRIIQTGTAVVPILSRLHSEVLINALDEDGNSAPQWMRLGLMTTLSKAVAVEGAGNERASQQLLQAGALNQLLGPDDFGRAGSRSIPELPELQSESMINYFYNQFGPGAVMETLQRLGSGQDMDDALEATTEMGEEEFFQSWFQSLSDENGPAVFDDE